MTDIEAQDCELEYWNQQAEDYALVQIPCEDLRAIITRAWKAPAFNSASVQQWTTCCGWMASCMMCLTTRSPAMTEREKLVELMARTIWPDAFAASTIGQMAAIVRCRNALTALEAAGVRLVPEPEAEG